MKEEEGIELELLYRQVICSPAATAPPPPPPQYYYMYVHVDNIKYYSRPGLQNPQIPRKSKSLGPSDVRVRDFHT